jgi:mono/diheme cytochrome c family protein
MRFFFITTILIILGGIKLSSTQTKEGKATTAKNQVVTAAVMSNGKKIYQQYCLTCHMADGAGVPNMNPPLVKTTRVLGDKTKLIQVILKGLNTGEEIDGETYTNVMPPHNFLNDQQVADVLTFVRNSFGNKSTKISPAEVKTVRSKKTE